jgi:hypothetical protein
MFRQYCRSLEMGVNEANEGKRARPHLPNHKETAADTSHQILASRMPIPHFEGGRYFRFVGGPIISDRLLFYRPQPECPSAKSGNIPTTLLG